MPHISEMFGFYYDTISKCGKFLLNSSDEEIGYCIFEEFDIGAVSFLHVNALNELRDEGIIDDTIYELSKSLRAQFMNLQGSDIWGVEYVRTSPEWLSIMVTSDEIRKAIHNRWSESDIRYLLPYCAVKDMEGKS